MSYWSCHAIGIIHIARKKGKHVTQGKIKIGFDNEKKYYKTVNKIYKVKTHT